MMWPKAWREIARTCPVLCWKAFAIEGCRSGALTVGQAAELLGTSHNEVDGLLKNAGVYLDYTLEDLDADRETYRRLGM